MTDKLCRISLFSAVLASIASMPSVSVAGLRVKTTHAGAHNQAMAIQQQYIAEQNIPVVQTASATETLPVEVEDKELAEDIKNNKSDSVTMADLDRCSMVDIRGVFKWGIPESGMRQTTQPQCMAVVDLKDANSGKVLATTTVAAGDAIKCNIDMFPESGYQPALSDVILPADNPPTEKDVEKALNKEQKQNAGFKIAAAAIIGGLAGNALAPKASGDSKLLGTSKTQLADTAIGALAAGGIMAASSYSGKVAGETIKSTAVNATAGMLVGNMGAGMTDNNSVLATTKCKVKNDAGKEVEKDCVIGHWYKLGESIGSNGTKYYATANGAVVYRCQEGTNNTTTCTIHNKPLQNISFANNRDTNSSGAIALSSAKAGEIAQHSKPFVLENSQMTELQIASTDSVTIYYLIASAQESENARMAYAVFDNLQSKAFGYKVSDFDNKLKNNNPKYYARYNNTDSVGDELSGDEGAFVFKPSARSSEDGSIIDLSNEARAKATMIGGAAGGALGGFVGYQGAQNEISERWVTAMTEYTDSLSNFYCATGGRFLSYYNGYAEVPSMRNSNEQD